MCVTVINGTEQTYVDLYSYLRHSKSCLRCWNLWPAHLSWRAASPDQVVTHARNPANCTRSNCDVKTNIKKA